VMGWLEILNLGGIRMAHAYLETADLRGANLDNLIDYCF